MFTQAPLRDAAILIGFSAVAVGRQGLVEKYNGLGEMFGLNGKYAGQVKRAKMARLVLENLTIAFLRVRQSPGALMSETFLKFLFNHETRLTQGREVRVGRVVAIAAHQFQGHALQTVEGKIVGRIGIEHHLAVVDGPNGIPV